MGKERVVVRKWMDMRGLLLDAMGMEKVNVVLPMICKILEWAKESKVFGKGNPWMVGVLNALAEVYKKEEKMSLRCEISLLCKWLDIGV